MNENKNIAVQKWFKKADNDLKTIENNLNAIDHPNDTSCFHAQQAIEKYIKGALVYYEQNAPKIHDLVVLLQKINHFIPDLSSLEDDLEKISEFAVESRYPDMLFEPSNEEVDEAYALALKIKEIIL